MVGIGHWTLGMVGIGQWVWWASGFGLDLQSLLLEHGEGRLEGVDELLLALGLLDVEADAREAGLLDVRNVLAPLGQASQALDVPHGAAAAEGEQLLAAPHARLDRELLLRQPRQVGLRHEARAAVVRVLLQHRLLGLGVALARTGEKVHLTLAEAALGVVAGHRGRAHAVERALDVDVSGELHAEGRALRAVGRLRGPAPRVVARDPILI